MPRVRRPLPPSFLPAVLGLLSTILLLPAFALSPLESDLMLADSEYTLEDGRCVFSVLIPSQQRLAGCYLQVAGLSDFTLALNGTLVDSASLFDSRDSSFTHDLSDHVGLLRPGTNTIEIASTQIDPRFRLRLWVSDMAWYLGSLHSHSTCSDGTHDVHELLELAADAGADFYAVTDHETIAPLPRSERGNPFGSPESGRGVPGQPRNPGVGCPGTCRPIRGLEWTTGSGHANILGLEGDSPIARDSIAQMIDDAKWRGGLVQMNHPRDLMGGWAHWPELDPGVDAIEIFNAMTWFPAGGWGDAQAVEWWQELLAEGCTIAATGNSDFHDKYPFEEPLNSCMCVRAPSNHPDSILKYVKLGRAMVCASPASGRLYLYADTSATEIPSTKPQAPNPGWDVVAGQHLRIADGPKAVRFRLEVEDAADGSVVALCDKDGVFFERTVDESDFEYEWTDTLTPRDTDFVRAELRTGLGAVYDCCTNPIYINHQDYEASGAAIRFPSAGIGGCTASLTARPETLRVGVPDTLRFRLSNNRGVSPYDFGLAVAYDTALFDLSAWQTAGEGIGEVARRSVGGYALLQWRGGYPWQNRLRPGMAFDYWLTFTPKASGLHPILLRSWAADRLFPDSAGASDLASPSWLTETLPVK